MLVAEALGRAGNISSPSDAQGSDVGMGPILKAPLLDSPFLRPVSLSSVFPMLRHHCLGTIWQILAKEKRLDISLSLPVGESVFIMYKEIHEEETVFAAEVLFHLSVVKTCQFYTQPTGLPNHWEKMMLKAFTTASLWMRFYVLIPLLLPASIIFPQVKSGGKDSHSTSYSKTTVSWRILTFLSKAPVRFDPVWGVWMVYFQLSLGIFPGFTSPLPFLFQSQTGRNKPVQNDSCDSTASRTTLRFSLPGVWVGGVPIDLLFHRVSTDLQSWTVYFSVMCPLCSPKRELFQTWALWDYALYSI